MELQCILRAPAEEAVTTGDVFVPQSFQEQKKTITEYKEE